MRWAVFTPVGVCHSRRGQVVHGTLNFLFSRRVMNILAAHSTLELIVHSNRSSEFEKNIIIQWYAMLCIILFCALLANIICRDECNYTDYSKAGVIHNHRYRNVLIPQDIFVIIRIMHIFIPESVNTNI